MIADLPTITNDEAWLDLRDGEQAVVRGRVTASGPAAHCISFSDWSELIVDADGSSFTLPLGADVELVITRTEDGVRTTHEDVAAAVEKWSYSNA